MLVMLSAWAFSVPIFALLAFGTWLKRSRGDLQRSRSLLGMVSLLIVFASRLSFGRLAYCGQIGGFGTHYMTLRASDTFLLVTFFAAMGCGAFRGKTRIFAVLAGFLMVGLWPGAEMVA
jgi:hypothetical protein